MTTLTDLATDVPEVAEFIDDCEREEGGQIRCRNALRVGASGKAALAATVAHYERLLLERERCGGCGHWRGGDYGGCRRADVLVSMPYERADPCHFIDADHPHGKFGPIGGE